jgi:hypothetical protein
MLKIVPKPIWDLSFTMTTMKSAIFNIACQVPNDSPSCWEIPKFMTEHGSVPSSI